MNPYIRAIKTSFMKSLFLSYIFCFFVLTCFSQRNNKADTEYPRFQFSSGIGLVKATNLPAGIDEQIAFGTKIDFNYHLQLSGKHYVTVGIGYENNRHIMDGLFSKNNNQYAFSITPAIFKQHELILQYLQFPVLYKYRWLNTSSISIGPYAGLLIDSKSKYKIGSGKFDGEAPLQNKLRWGLQAECELLSVSDAKSKTGSVFGIGLQYQFSKHLQDSRSFKPFFLYFKVGITIK